MYPYFDVLMVIYILLHPVILMLLCFVPFVLFPSSGRSHCYFFNPIVFSSFFLLNASFNLFVAFCVLAGHSHLLF